VKKPNISQSNQEGEAIMTRRRIIAFLGLAGIVAVVLAASWHTSARSSTMNCWWRPRFYTLDGVWLINGDTGSVSTITFVPSSPANQRVSFSCDAVNFDPTLGGLLPQASPLQNMALRGTLVRTGPNTFDYSWIVYSRNELREIVYILIARGNIVLTDADTYEDSLTISWYSAAEQVSPVFGPLPDQDMDGDGLPDEDEDPILSVPITGVARRLESVLP
jgi:hypothetical protein